MFEKMTVEEYCNLLASENPAPGGGSALALIGAAACSLVEMSLNVTLQKKKDDDVDFYYLVSAKNNTSMARKKLTQLANDDSEAYSRIVAARKMPKDSDAEAKERSTALQKAFHKATLVPLDVMSLSLDVAKKASSRVLPNVTKYVRSDCEIGIDLLKTVIKNSVENVYGNTCFIHDEQLRATLEKRAENIITELNALK